MKPLLRELRLSTSQMYRPIVCQVEAIVKQPTGTMLTTNVSTIAGHRMILEQVEVHFYQLLIQVSLVVVTQFGMIISTFMRPVWPLMTSSNASSRACKPLQNAPGDLTAAATFAERLPTSPYAPQSNPDKEIDQSDLFTINSKQSRTMQARKWRQANRDWLLRKTAVSKAWLVMLVQVTSWSLMWLSLETGTNLLNKWGQSYLSSW